MPARYRGDKPGEYLRSWHRREFDEWYAKVFVKNHENLPEEKIEPEDDEV